MPINGRGLWICPARGDVVIFVDLKEKEKKKAEENRVMDAPSVRVSELLQAQSWVWIKLIRKVSVNTSR